MHRDQPFSAIFQTEKFGGISLEEKTDCTKEERAGENELDVRLSAETSDKSYC